MAVKDEISSFKLSINDNLFIDDAAPFRTGRRRSTSGRKRMTYMVVGWAVLALWIIGGVQLWNNRVVAMQYSGLFTDKQKAVLPTNSSQTPLHLLLPATRPDVNLCKLLLGTVILGYPKPNLLAWNESYDQESLRGGGSHTAKVSRVLAYLDALDESHATDLVVMLDAYDIHLQLPRSVLVDRFYSIRDESNKRLVASVGKKTVKQERLQQRVLFGSGKRCAPNQRHTVACYPVPESPLPDDLYGIQTDTIYGRNQFYSNKQRFLNSGYIIGEVADMKKLFRDAWKLIEEHPEQDPVDSGSHTSDFMYGGSDQSIFAAMFGRQEWAREKLRLKHAPWGAKPRSTKIYGTFIDNVLSPSLLHEEVNLDLSRGNPFEYGIFLDYWSEIGHQTKNSEEDATWITYGGSTLPQDQVGYRSPFDCPTRIPAKLPTDILRSSTSCGEKSELAWTERSLYTHLCLSTIPVFIHMNGYKEHREERWPKLWWHPHVSKLLQDSHQHLPRTRENGEVLDNQDRTGLGLLDNIMTDKGVSLSWAELCPASFHVDLAGNGTAVER